MAALESVVCVILSFCVNIRSRIEMKLGLNQNRNNRLASLILGPERPTYDSTCSSKLYEF